MTKTMFTCFYLSSKHLHILQRLINKQCRFTRKLFINGDMVNLHWSTIFTDKWPF